MRNGKLEKTFPVSMGKKGYETKNGTYYVLEKFADIVMDSSTYGVPVNSAQGYKLKVQDAVRIDNSGAFVHSAPWSTGAQGNSNVSHGCINLSPANAQWFYDNFGSGDPVVINNSSGHVQPARRRVGLADVLAGRRRQKPPNTGCFGGFCVMALAPDPHPSLRLDDTARLTRRPRTRRRTRPCSG